MIGCGDITGDVRYGPELKEDRICHRTLKYSNRRCSMTQYAAYDHIWFSNHDIKTAERDKAQKMFKVQQPKTKTKTKQRGIVLFRRKTR